MEGLDDGERQRRAPTGVFAKAGAVATGGLMTASARHPSSQPNRRLNQTAGSGGQLTGRIFTTRCDPTRSSPHGLGAKWDFEVWTYDSDMALL